jgi:integrase/recombinase XerD
MDETIRTAAISPLRQRLIDDMNMRQFSRETQRNYIRDVGRFATFLRRSPDTATADDVRRFQIEQRDAGVPTPTMNSIVSALRFFFTHTIDRPDLARKVIRVAHPRTLPVVLSRDEVARLLNATTCLKLMATLTAKQRCGRVASIGAAAGRGRFERPGLLSGGAEVRLDVLNLTDAVYQIRNGTGVGVGAPQYGLRRTVLAGLIQRF